MFHTDPELTGTKVAATVDMATAEAAVVLVDLTAERWGKALVLAVEGPPSTAEALLVAFVEGALQRALGRDVSALGLGRANEVFRMAVLNRAAADRAREWQQSGASWVQPTMTGSPSLSAS